MRGNIDITDLINDLDIDFTPDGELGECKKCGEEKIIVCDLCQACKECHDKAADEPPLTEFTDEEIENARENGELLMRKMPPTGIESVDIYFNGVYDLYIDLLPDSGKWIRVEDVVDRFILDVDDDDTWITMLIMDLEEYKSGAVLRFGFSKFSLYNIMKLRMAAEISKLHESVIDDLEFNPLPIHCNIGHYRSHRNKE